MSREQKIDKCRELFDKGVELYWGVFHEGRDDCSILNESLESYEYFDQALRQGYEPAKIYLGILMLGRLKSMYPHEKAQLWAVRYFKDIVDNIDSLAWEALLQERLSGISKLLSTALTEYGFKFFDEEKYSIAYSIFYSAFQRGFFPARLYLAICAIHKFQEGEDQSVPHIINNFEKAEQALTGEDWQEIIKNHGYRVQDLRIDYKDGKWLLLNLVIHCCNKGFMDEAHQILHFLQKQSSDPVIQKLSLILGQVLHPGASRQFFSSVDQFDPGFEDLEKQLPAQIEFAHQQIRKYIFDNVKFFCQNFLETLFTNPSTIKPIITVRSQAAIEEKKSNQDSQNADASGTRASQKNTYFLERARALRRQGQYKDALEILNKGLAQYKFDYRLLLKKADLCSQISNLGVDAKQVYEEFFKVMAGQLTTSDCCKAYEVGSISYVKYLLKKDQVSLAENFSESFLKKLDNLINISLDETNYQIAKIRIITPLGRYYYDIQNITQATKKFNMVIETYRAMANRKFVVRYQITLCLSLLATILRENPNECLSKIKELSDINKNQALDMAKQLKYESLFSQLNNNQKQANARPGKVPDASPQAASELTF